jgi:ATP-dependent DNA ligase
LSRRHERTATGQFAIDGEAVMLGVDGFADFNAALAQEDREA